MSAISLLLLCLIVYAIPALTVLAIASAFVKAKLIFAHSYVLIAPVIIWVGLSLLASSGKSLSNAVYEPAIMAIANALLLVAAIQVIERCRMDGLYANLALHLPGISVAIIVYFCFPVLPE